MKKIILIGVPVIIAIGLCLQVPAADNGNFGGNGKAWTDRSLGGNSYYQHTSNQNLRKDWETPSGEVRFTQPGKSEGQADSQSVIKDYPCPGTQVYPGSNSP